MLEAEKTHREHAIVEQVIADFKGGALAHLTSSHFAANGAWLVMAAIAFNLTRAAGTIASVFHANATTVTIRRQLIAVPGPAHQVRAKAGHPPSQGLALAGQLGRTDQHGLRATKPSNDLTTAPQQAQPKTPVEKPDRPAATSRPHTQTGPESHSPTQKLRWWIEAELNRTVTPANWGHRAAASPDVRAEPGIPDTGTMSHPAGQPVPDPAERNGLRVLVVDDERALADLVGSYLNRDGFEVTMAYDGRQAIDQARQVDPEVMVLDLGLPIVDGVEVCRVVRTFSDCYIVMLTARTEEIDKLIGLSVGADDYLTKPFSPRELVARIHAMLRRPRASTRSGEPAQEAPPRVFGALSIDVAGREVCVDGQAVGLTRTEFDMLEALSARPKLVFTRRQLIDTVWNQSWVGDEHLVDVHVGHLRRKLGDDPSSPRYVFTVRGIGYRMGEGL